MIIPIPHTTSPFTSLSVDCSKTPLVKWSQRRNLVTLTIPYGRGEGRGTVVNEKVPVTGIPPLTIVRCQVTFEPNGRVLVEFGGKSGAAERC